MMRESLIFGFRTMILCLTPALLFFYKQPKRRHWKPVLMAGVVLYVAFIWCWSYFFDNFFRSESALLACSTYLIQYLIISAILFACLDVDLITVVFCSTVAYSLEQLTSRFHGLVGLLYAGSSSAAWWGHLSTVVLAAAIYTIGFFTFIWRKDKKSRVINVVKPVQLIIATLAMAMMIYIEQANAPVLAYANSTKAVALNYLSSIIFSLFVLALEYNMLSKEEIKGELLTTRQILEQERLQYELKKDVVDVINIKCHDLRHQLASVGGIMHEAELTKIENAIGLYDISKKTGNRALDVVLTLQSIVCYNKGVDFTCVAEGERLGFMSESDIYSLFNNILDNAVEAVLRIQDPEKRIILLTVLSRNHFLFIHEENYCEEDLQFQDGIPQTTKQDTEYHGFGMRSILATINTYGGDCSITLEDHIFSLDIMFPI